MPLEWHPGTDGRRSLDKQIALIKEENRKNPYDAMVGLSGGVDSAYLAHFLRTHYDMRLLAVHVDGKIDPNVGT